MLVFLGARSRDSLLGLVKSHKGSESFALIANLQVSLHGFMDAGRRHETPVAHLNFVANSTARRMSSIFALLPLPLLPSPLSPVPQGQC